MQAGLSAIDNDWFMCSSGLRLKKDLSLRTMRPLYTIILQVSLLPVLHCYVLRLSCKHAANFTIEKVGYFLKGSTLKKLGILNREKCFNSCMVHQQCKAINMKKYGTVAECNLLKRSSEDPNDNVQLTQRDGWSFWSTNYSDPLVGDICKSKQPCDAGVLCLDTCECPGFQCVKCKDHAKGLHCNINNETSCKVYYDKGIRKDGVFNIKTGRKQQLKVYCYMKSLNKNGWLVIRRRRDAKVSFDRTWKDYEDGFGSRTGNFWLGLSNIHKLAGPGQGAWLKVHLKYKDVDNPEKQYSRSIDFHLFEVGSALEKYRLEIGQAIKGSAGDFMGKLNGTKFSTVDQNNIDADRSCSVLAGGFWFKRCNNRPNLNGLYPTTSNYLTAKAMSWENDQYKNNQKIEFSEMLIYLGGAASRSTAHTAV